MHRFSRLPEGYALLLCTLFPPRLEYFDLLRAFQSWGRGPVTLTSDQVRDTLNAIRREAIPRALAVVAAQQVPAMREDARATLEAWRVLEVLLS